MIITQTPYRISFFGGGTDYPTWFREYGGAVLSSAINKYCYISIRNLPPFFEHKHRIVYSQIESVKELSEIKHPAVRAVLEQFNQKDGIEIHHDGDLPARSGIGSSSSFTVGMLKAMYAVHGRMVSKYDLGSQAVNIEQNVIGEAVGSQDQIAAAYGGINKITFHQDNTFTVDPVIITSDRIREFNSNLLLFFTGFSRTAAVVAQTKIDNMPNRKRQLMVMKAFVDEGVTILQNERRSLDEIGTLLHESWKLKRELSEKVTTGAIDEIYQAGLDAGAVGGKILGAGGGGFALFYVRPENQAAVRERLKNLIEVSFAFDYQGSRIALYDPSFGKNNPLQSPAFSNEPARRLHVSAVLETVDVDVCIIGAGVVGLAIAEAISRRSPELSVFVFERHGKFGQEASSHNSEVIHAGIYYKPGSYKAASCIQGRDLLYSFCDEHDVPYAKCGKYIVASDDGQAAQLEKIRSNAALNGVELEPVSGADATARLGLDVASALWSPLSGIVDSHTLMQRLMDLAANRGVHFLFNHRFDELIERSDESTHFMVSDPTGDKLAVRCRMFVNAAGLGAARVAKPFDLADRWDIKACRGRYFFLSSQWTGRYRSLIYPMPDPRGGLGTHLTIDLSGRGRLGPDVDWPTGSPEPDDWGLYKFDENVDELRSQFYEAGRRFLPDLQLDDLHADYVGVRAKLFKNGEAFQEFVLEASQPGVVHCLGIESPGVTASLAIGHDVAAQLIGASSLVAPAEASL